MNLLWDTSIITTLLLGSWTELEPVSYLVLVVKCEQFFYNGNDGGGDEDDDDDKGRWKYPLLWNLMRHILIHTRSFHVHVKCIRIILVYIATYILMQFSSFDHPKDKYVVHYPYSLRQLIIFTL